MAITRHDISLAQGAEKGYLLQAILLEEETQQLLDDFANDGYDLIMAHASASGLQDAPDVADGLIELLAAMLILFDEFMYKRIGNIGTVKKDLFLEQALPLLRSAGATKAADAFKVRMNNFATDMQRTFRTMPSGKYDLTYNDRMATIERSTQSVIRNLVTTGVRDKLTAKQIAQRFDAYVNPVPGEQPVRPWDVIRNATRSTKSFVPRDVMSGSLQTNLHAIARTQSAESFRTATLRAFDPEPWVKGYRWVLSSSHPRPDVCDEHAAHGLWPKDGAKPYSHDHCLCDYVAEYASRDEVRRLLQQGEL